MDGDSTVLVSKVGDIQDFVVGGKGKTTWPGDTVGNNTAVTRGWVVAVYVAGWELRFGSITTFVPICRIGEIEAFIHHVCGDIAGGVEWAPLEVIQQHVRVVRAFRINVDQTGRLLERALSTYYNPRRGSRRIGRTACCQVLAILSANLVTRQVLRRKELNLGYFRALASGRDCGWVGVPQQIGGEEEC